MLCDVCDIGLVRVLDVVNISMESKAKLYESSTLSAIFLMNNYHFIRHTFTRYVFLFYNS